MKFQIQKQLKNFNKKMRYAVFKQMHFYYKFNLQSKNESILEWYKNMCKKIFEITSMVKRS